jgi:CheY-like chemotaxis protein
LSGLPVKLLHRDGSRRFFSISASPNLDGEGRINNIICLLKDQTGERELQTQLFQAQKMEAIGTLAGGIAHDFNNLLMGIQANISLVRMDNNQGKKGLDRIDSIERQIQTGASLTRQLLGYARKGKYRPAPLCLNPLVQGMASVYGVVNNHNGVIKVSSKPGEGTTFDLYFQTVMDACHEPAQRESLHPGSGRILFVDDEPELLKVEAELMEHIGYQVTCTQSSFEALHYLSENPDSFDLVIIDMVMPGMGGRELYGHIRRLSPEMRILFSTGFGDVSETADLLTHDHSDMIYKPYTAEALSQKIINMLGGPEIDPMPSCAGAS